MTYQIDTNMKSAEEVLSAFSLCSEDFDASILNEFITKYPQYREQLLRYATVWLNTPRASDFEIANLEVPITASLKTQSKLLQMWDKAFAGNHSNSIDNGVKTLATFVGAKGLRDFSFAVFKTHDEELEPLAMELLDAGITGIPRHYLVNLSESLGCDVLDVSVVFGRYQAQVARQTYHSSTAKPTVSTPRSWAEVVDELEINPAKKAELLRSE